MPHKGRRRKKDRHATSQRRRQMRHSARPSPQPAQADGLTDEELKRPLVAVFNSRNDIIPGHNNLDKICEAVKAGIYMAGGVPFEISTIGVCDGIAMNHDACITRSCRAKPSPTASSAPSRAMPSMRPCASPTATRSSPACCSARCA